MDFPPLKKSRHIYSLGFVLHVGGMDDDSAALQRHADGHVITTAKGPGAAARASLRQEKLPPRWVDMGSPSGSMLNREGLKEKRA